MRRLQLNFLKITGILLIIIYSATAIRNSFSIARLQQQLLALQSNFHPKNAESRLASGIRLKLRHCDFYTLELIPRISDTLAQRILDQRFQILAEASTLEIKDKYKAIKLVRGIGELEALRLSQYLDLG